MTAILLDVWVPGRPRPKGSLRHVGKGRMVEQVASSGDWRAAVAFNARQELDRLEQLGNPPGTYLGPVTVAIRLRFTPPKSWDQHSLPSSRATGDVDKHARNILDALQDAGVIKDDAQVCELRVDKAYSVVGSPGAQVRVVTAGA